MHQQHVRIAAHADGERLAGAAPQRHAAADAGRLLKDRKHMTKQAGLFGPMSSMRA